MYQIVWYDVLAYVMGYKRCINNSICVQAFVISLKLECRKPRATT